MLKLQCICQFKNKKQIIPEKKHNDEIFNIQCKNELVDVKVPDCYSPLIVTVYLPI